MDFLLPAAAGFLLLSVGAAFLLGAILGRSHAILERSVTDLEFKRITESH